MMCAAVCAIAAPARAQDAVPGRFEIAAGVTWTGSMSLGTPAATETAPSGRFTLFSTSTQVSSAAGVEARVGVRLTPRFVVEASSSYSRPVLRAAISGDAENAAPVTATDTLREITVDGALAVDLLREERIHRASPFIVAGAGYLRQLHEGDTLAVNGQRYFAGGGVRFLLMSRPRKLKGLGVRADARALLQRKGAAFDGRLHASPTVAASIFARF
jgi:hypothetical protein